MTTNTVGKKREYPTLYVVVGTPFSEKEIISNNLSREFTPLVFSDKNLSKDLNTPEKICDFINKETHKALNQGREVLIKHSLAEKEVYRKMMIDGLNSYRKVAVFADTPMYICEARQKRTSQNAFDLEERRRKIEVPVTKEGFDCVNINRNILFSE